MFSEQPIEEERIREWLAANGGKADYCAVKMDTGALENPEWLLKAHGAELLTDLFRHFSDNQEEYRKRSHSLWSHSLWITEWLIENDPGAFTDLIDFLSELLPKD